MWGIGLLLTIVRLLIRYHYQGGWFGDDALQMCAMFSLTALATVTELQRDTIYDLKTAASTKGGSTGNDMPMITNSTREQAKLQFLSIILFWLCLWSIKGSILAFYRRLFSNLKAYLKWWWLVAMACMTTFVACILANFLECLPLHRRLQLGLEGEADSYPLLFRAHVNRLVCGDERYSVPYLDNNLRHPHGYLFDDPPNQAIERSADLDQTKDCDWLCLHAKHSHDHILYLSSQQSL